MLALSRKLGEKVVIGDNIVVIVHRMAGNRVSLAIEAPKATHILRGELAQEGHAKADRERSVAATRAGGQTSAANGPTVLPGSEDLKDAARPFEAQGRGRRFPR